jgi:macrodomain Ter protein organizer (MatP/YcbG family)
MNNLQFEKLHPFNLKHLKAVVKQYGAAWIHGDGNIYHTEKLSNDAQQFVNTQFSSPTYRVKYTLHDTLPTTIEELEKALQDSKTKEIKNEKKQVETKALPIVQIEDDEVETVIEEKAKVGKPAKADK